MSKTKIAIMKDIVEELKQGCLDFRQIKETIEKFVRSKKYAKFQHASSESIRKRVSRIVEELVKLGLVVERGDKYCWYIYTVELDDYGVRLKHSNQLLSALNNMIGIRPASEVFNLQAEVYDEHMKPLETYAEDHLRTYENVWKLLEKYRRLKSETNARIEMFRQNLMKSLKESFEAKTISDPSEASKHDRFVGANLPRLIIYHVLFGSQSSPTLNTQNGEVRFEESLVGKGKEDLFSEICNFIKIETEDETNKGVISQIQEMQRETSETFTAFEGEINKLILRIQGGIPLQGRCELCRIHVPKSPDQ